MRLNYDCVRNLLLTLEDLIVLNEDLEPKAVSLDEVIENPLMANYSKPEITYTSLKLNEANYIQMRIIEADNCIFNVLYFSVTFDGHQYLDSIRSPQVWEQVKAMFAEKSISMTLDLIFAAAPKIASRFLNL